MRELFIYYRIEGAGAATARATAQGFQARLCARHPGLTARLLRRPEQTSDQQTWMETYSYAGEGGVSAALEAEIAAEALLLAPFITGARHVEVFVPCAS